VKELEALLDRLVERIADRVVERLEGRVQACAKGVQKAVQPCAPDVGTTFALDLVSSPTEKDLNLEDSITRAKSRPESAFERWWAVYPRKVNKRRALLVWQKLGLDPIADDLIAKLEAQVAGHHQWRDLQYVPHATTYLNGEQWNDAIEQAESTGDRLARVNGWQSLDGAGGYVRGQTLEGVLGGGDAPSVEAGVLEHDDRGGSESAEGLSWLR
jgi:hypothetical protein